MEFRTELKVQKSSWDLRHGHSVLSLGSCFADFIGNKLEQNQFEIVSNPFGTIYNPMSIFENLASCVEEKLIDLPAIVSSRGMFFSYRLHSEVFSESKEGLLKKIELIQEQVSKVLSKTDYLIITLGTAWVYELNGCTVSVANCHKMPAQTFKRRLLEVSEIVEAFTGLVQKVKAINPNLRIITTVSPVRHIKDTLVLNSVSKSILLLACHKASQLVPDVQYFPSFELVTDDLRDYRFYKEDLIHPNSVALQYIWEKFREMYFSEETRLISEDIASIYLALQHKTLHPNSCEHEQFKKKIVEKVNKLNVKVAIPRLIEEVNLKLKY